VAPPKRKALHSQCFSFWTCYARTGLRSAFQVKSGALLFTFSSDCIGNHNVAESGPHSPLGDRQARLPVGERANIRAKREIPGIIFIDFPSVICYNETPNQ